MITLHPIRRVTVIAESILEQELILNFQKLGARGFTVMTCRGKGRHEVMANIFTGIASVRIELLVQEEVAERIMEYLNRDYFQNYAVIACIDPVQVARPEQF